MEVLSVLLVSFVLSLLFSKLIKKKWKITFSGNLAMCFMLCFTAIGHVIYAKGMTMIIPPIVPFRLEIVYITGLMEIIMGVILLFPKYRRVMGIVIVLFFVFILPANIYEAVSYIDLTTGTYTGAGPMYLFFRIPLQLFFIVWVYWFSVKR